MESASSAEKQYPILTNFYKLPSCEIDLGIFEYLLPILLTLGKLCAIVIRLVWTQKQNSALLLTFTNSGGIWLWIMVQSTLPTIWTVSQSPTTPCMPRDHSPTWIHTKLLLDLAGSSENSSFWNGFWHCTYPQCMKILAFMSNFKLSWSEFLQQQQIS